MKDIGENIKRYHGILFFKIYHFIYNCKSTQNLSLKLMRHTPRFYSNILFETTYGKKINWNNPIWFDEKLNVLKCGYYYNNEKVIECADKFRVREYIKKKGLEKILNPIYCDAETVEELDISNLPSCFVIKRNNDAGGVLVVSDKQKVTDWQQQMQELGRTMTRTFGIQYAEYHYQHIKPHYFIEQYIGKADGSFPYDFKFYCMNGVPRAALICVGRENEEELLRFLVDMEFHKLDFMQGEKEVTDREIQKYKPKDWKELIDTARILASDFPFVRVDLYDLDGKVLFGEMTFTPMCCRNYYFSEMGQVKLGNWLDISKIK